MTKQNMINKLHVSNFKSLQDFDLILGSLTMLIGANEAGKSNILDALALLKDLFRSSLMPNIAGDPIDARGGYKDVVWRGEDRKAITLSVEGQLGFNSTFEYTVRIELVGNHWAITDEILTIPPEQPTKLRSSPTNWSYGTLSGSINGNQLAIVRIQNESTLVKQVIQSISTWRFYHLSSELMRRANQTIPVRGLDDNGANLSALVHTLISEADPLMETIEENVKSFSPSVERILAPLSKSGQTYVAVRERGLKQRIPAWAMSDGALFCLGLAVAFFGPETTDLIAFEEPDAYAHAHLLEVIAEMLQAAADHRQVIGTTHRTHLLDYLPPDSITIVEKTNGATKCIRAKDKKKYLKAIKELGASKAWYSGHIGGIP